jgi:hypothetical protein
VASCPTRTSLAVSPIRGSPVAAFVHPTTRDVLVATDLGCVGGFAPAGAESALGEPGLVETSVGKPSAGLASALSRPRPSSAVVIADSSVSFKARKRPQHRPRAPSAPLVAVMVSSSKAILDQVRSQETDRQA